MPTALSKCTRRRSTFEPMAARCNCTTINSSSSTL
ncbi:hypothetical protein [Bacillus velezensis]